MSFVGRNNCKISARPSGGGCKLQGITSTTDRRASAIRAIQDRAWGDQNRHIIFCLNQLGGVGRNKSQFHTPADGVEECPVWNFFPEGISIPDGNYLEKYYLNQGSPTLTKAIVKNNILQHQYGTVIVNQDYKKTVDNKSNFYHFCTLLFYNKITGQTKFILLPQL